MHEMQHLLDFWRAHTHAELALATLVGKRGSSYRAPGAKKLVGRADIPGNDRGLLSGGCLESAINQAARHNWDRLPFRQSFSTLDEADRLLGFQTGCAGEIEILFERLPAYAAGDPALYIPFGPPRDGVAGVAVSLDAATLGQRRYVARPPAAGFFDSWITPLTLNIIGCGIDAAPFAALAEPLGWTVQFLDYRPPSWRAELPMRQLPLAELGAIIPDGPHSAVVLMTHNYEADLEILAQLQDKRPGYLACLGPRARFDQLQADLLALRGLTLPPALLEVIAAPAGLWRKDRDPAAIALSIVAQIHAKLYERLEAHD